jgi:hypothetical protein
MIPSCSRACARGRPSAPYWPAAARELLARLRAGEARAFEELVIAQQHRVFGVALRMLGSRAEAEEIAQEVWKHKGPFSEVRPCPRAPSHLPPGDGVEPLPSYRSDMTGPPLPLDLVQEFTQLLLHGPEHPA